MEIVKVIVTILMIGMTAGVFAVLAFVCWLLTSKDLDPNNEENDQNF